MPNKVSVYRTLPSAPASTAALSEELEPAQGEAQDAARELPAPARPRMLQALPVKYLETRPPLMYRLITESETTRSHARIAKSRIYRANAFSCTFFYKQISRCLIEWED